MNNKEIENNNCNWFNSSGHLSQYAITNIVTALYKDSFGALPEEVAEHIENCRICRQEIMAVYDINELFMFNKIKRKRKGDNDFDEPKIKYKRIPNFMKVAASLALFFAIGVVLIILLQNQKRSEVLSVKKRLFDQKGHEVIIPSDEKPFNDKKNIANTDSFQTKGTLILADAFTPDKTLDLLVGEVFRSNFFNLISPVTDTTYYYGDTIHFIWEGSDNIELIVADNKGKEWFKTNTSNTYCIAGEDFSYGLFYIKVFNLQGMVHVGRIKVIYR